MHGDFGYQGCTWIHQTNLMKSEADRKVAADYVDKQYKKVQRSLEGLVEIHRDPRVLSVQVIGNGDIPVILCHYYTTVRWASMSTGWPSAAFSA